MLCLGLILQRNQPQEEEPKAVTAQMGLQLSKSPGTSSPGLQEFSGAGRSWTGLLSQAEVN